MDATVVSSLKAFFVHSDEDDNSNDDTKKNREKALTQSYVIDDVSKDAMINTDDNDKNKYPNRVNLSNYVDAVYAYSSSLMEQIGNHHTDVSYAHELQKEFHNGFYAKSRAFIEDNDDDDDENRSKEALLGIADAAVDVFNGLANGRLDVRQSEYLSAAARELRRNLYKDICGDNLACREEHREGYHLFKYLHEITKIVSRLGEDKFSEFVPAFLDAFAKADLSKIFDSKYEDRLSSSLVKLKSIPMSTMKGYLIIMNAALALNNVDLMKKKQNVHGKEIVFIEENMGLDKEGVDKLNVMKNELVMWSKGERNDLGSIQRRMIDEIRNQTIGKWKDSVVASMKEMIDQAIRKYDAVFKIKHKNKTEVKPKRNRFVLVL